MSKAWLHNTANTRDIIEVYCLPQFPYITQTWRGKLRWLATGWSSHCPLKCRVPAPPSCITSLSSSTDNGNSRTNTGFEIQREDGFIAVSPCLAVSLSDINKNIFIDLFEIQYLTLIHFMVIHFNTMFSQSPDNWHSSEFLSLLHYYNGLINSHLRQILMVMFEYLPWGHCFSSHAEGGLGIVLVVSSSLNLPHQVRRCW